MSIPYPNCMVTLLRYLPLLALIACTAQNSTGQDLRTWTDSTGKYQIEAAYGGIVEGNIKLLKSDGSTVLVPFARISAVDQQYVRGLAQARPSAPATSGVGNGWFTFAGPNGNWTTGDTGLISEFPADGPKVLWKTPLGTGFSGLVVGGGKVYTIFGRDGQETVGCFDAKTGREVWTVVSGSDYAEGRSHGPRATPALDGNRLFTVGATGHVMCLDAASGNKVWNYNLHDKFSMRPHNEGLSPSPLVDGQNVILCGGSSAIAVNKATGEQVWRALDEEWNHSTPVFSMISGRRQLVTLTGQNMVGLDPSNGSELWRYEQRGVNAASPVVGPGGRVFGSASYGFGCHLVQVNGGSAERVYKRNELATHHATALLHEGFLYGFHDRPGRFKCINFESGQEQWEASPRDMQKGKMVMADGKFFVLAESGGLYIVPVNPMQFQSSAYARGVLSGQSFTAPSLVDGILYIRTDKEMAAVDLRG